MPYHEQEHENYTIVSGSDDFAIASFTGPEHDTPSTLKKYAEDVDKNASWNFLTGDKLLIYSLANEGFNIFASINPAVAGIEHQGYFALIDKDGFIRSRQDDFGNPIVYYMGIDQMMYQNKSRSTFGRH